MCYHFHGICVSIAHRLSGIRHILAVLLTCIPAPSFLDLQVQIPHR